MKHKHYLISAGIFSFALLIVLWAFNCVNISEDRRWTDLTQTFLYPLSCTLIGSVILSCAAIAISNNILDRYNNRIGYGLTNRKIYFEGDSDSIKTIRDALQISDLIKRETIWIPASLLSRPISPFSASRKRIKNRATQIQKTLVVEQLTLRNTARGRQRQLIQSLR